MTKRIEKTMKDNLNGELDLIDKLLVLEEDKERVESVRFFYNIIGYCGLSAQILLKNNFRNINEFEDYIKSKKLPNKLIWKDNGSYFIKDKEVVSEFFALNS